MSYENNYKKQMPDASEVEVKKESLGMAAETAVNGTCDEGTKIVLCCSCGGGGGSAKIEEEKDIKL